MTLTFYDAFHGVGGFRYGLEQAGMKCVGGCEIDKYACQAYGVINDEDCRPTDIRTVDPFRLPDFDCFVFGWPCQDNSIAGKREGQIERNDTNEGNRSGLLFEAARIIRVKKPKYFIAENVEGLFSVNGGIDFYATIRLFTDMGYDCQWQLLNTRWFLPQNRERIFFVGHLRGERRPEIFPIVEADYQTIGERRTDSVIVLHKTHGNSTSIKRGETGTLQAARLDKVPNIVVAGMLDIKGDDYIKRVYDPKGIAPSLPTMQGGMQEPKIIQRGRGFNHGGLLETVPTITKNSWQDNNHLYDGYSIRKLTPLECFRLQGYPDWWLYKCKEAGISDSQLYKMAGNGVSSPVSKAVGVRLLKLPQAIETTEPAPAV